MNHTCYKCEIILAENNFSIEHVILNACGGKLKSKNLLCKDCNSKFGVKFDKELAKSVNPLANLLRIKRDRGNPPKIEGLNTISNTQYYLEYNGEINLKKSVINEIGFDNDDISKRKFNIKSPNKRILKQVLDGLKRSYPDLDIDKGLEKASVNEKPFDEELRVNMSIGGSDTFKSITKTAINFYMLNGGKRNEIKHLFDYLDDKENLNIVWFHYPHTKVYNYRENEVTHVIKIVGKTEEKILYAYVELFNTHCFIIKLNDNYNGQNLDVDYIFNVLSHKTENNLTKLDLNRKELTNIFTDKDVNPNHRIQEKLNRIIRIVQLNDLKREISKSIDDIFSKYIGQKVNKDILEELRGEFAEKIKPYINFKKK